MGQRHQAFLIARVGVGNRHRCVAALHHQWCYGTLPLRAARRFVTLVKQKDNAAVVRGELRALDNVKDGDDFESPTPCPYSRFLLWTAFSVDLETAPKYTSACIPLDARIGCFDGDYEDGLTVIDVTHPEQPAYTFITYNQGPINAEMYLSLYYDDSEWTETHDEVVRALHDVPMIALAHLEEAWPELSRYRKTNPRSSTSACDGPLLQDCSQPSATVTLPSLSETSLKAAVMHVVETGDSDALNAIPWFIAKQGIIESILRDLNPFPETALDLTRFPGLAGKQISSLVASIGTVEWLDVSFNKFVTATDLAETISATPSLRRVVAMCCPSIPNAEIIDAVVREPLRYRTLEALLHPAFLAPTNLVAPVAAFTFVWYNVTGFPRPFSYTQIPFFTPAQILQTIADFAPWTWPDRNAYYRFQSVIIASLTAGTRHPEQRWSERSVVAVPLRGAVGHDPYDALIPAAGHMWAFYCFWDPNNTQPYPRTDAKNALRRHSYGFIRYRFTGPRDDNIPPQSDIYDLAGFLECMSQEGRPLPPPEAVDKVQAILSMVSPETGELECALIDENSVPPLGYAY
ncbi:hypothetical protein BN946_scf184840.g7 [Trametes cinnabarina]|uniref:Uncharacterized protein n=1 Tax=Pycnoporus cinnabarinus TaxID=5643 RepID=A0A060STR0_PYCCI|nr:hypothetical protein BN946_scf184840.g7 [Trametes cinnabarina]